ALSGEVDSVRDDLLSAYGSNGDAVRLFDNAGIALRVIGYSYEKTDEAQAAAYDAKLEQFDDIGVPWTSNNPGISMESYVSGYSSPPDSAFDEYDAFMEISEGVDYILAFDWIGDVLGGIGLPDPIAGVKADLEGDWSKVGKALGGIKLVVSYWYQVMGDLDGMIKGLDGQWTGHAASSAMTWIDELENGLGDHAKALNKTGQRIKSEALALKSAIDTMTDLVDKIVELLPDPSDLKSLFGDVLGAFKDVASKIWTFITLFKEAFDVALTAAFGIVSVFAQITRFWDTDFPEIPAWDAPDVNGPAL
ncbi:MAG: WXG100 family type VII secretion target, partial [Nocardioides sp.]